MEKIITITKGPSKQALFDGLQFHCEKGPIPFTIMDEEGFEITPKAEVLKIESQSNDKTGNLWWVTLAFERNALVCPSVWDKDQEFRHYTDKVEVSYSTQTETGGFKRPNY